MLSVGSVFSSRVAEAAAVFSGSAGVVEATGVSIGCNGGSVAWAGLAGNSVGIEVVAASLDDVTGAWGFGASEVMCSADGVT